MAKMKMPRRDISLDMTAMCDMAFLLLTFFMLTTKFKPNEAVLVDIPSSVSELKLPESNLITVLVEKDGTVHFGVGEPNTRLAMLKGMSDKYQLNFSAEEQQQFAQIDAFGTPLASLKSILALDADQRSKFKMPGIPVDSAANELKDWLRLALDNIPEGKIAIKGDKDTDYKVVERVIAILQEQNINKFNLITTLEM
jgi:biopolymer transport protein ExbD